MNFDFYRFQKFIDTLPALVEEDIEKYMRKLKEREMDELLRLSECYAKCDFNLEDAIDINFPDWPIEAKAYVLHYVMYNRTIPSLNELISNLKMDFIS